MEFILTSDAFNNNEPIPERYTCEGEDISPALEWMNPPKGTQSFVLIVNDYEAVHGTWTHWVVYNIPHNINKLDQGISSLPEPAKHGLNTWKQKKYGGPCPPQSLHHYHFDLYALDDWLDLGGDVTSLEIQKALDGHVLGTATLIGLYQKKH